MLRTVAALAAALVLSVIVCTAPLDAPARFLRGDAFAPNLAAPRVWASEATSQGAPPRMTYGLASAGAAGFKLPNPFKRERAAVEETKPEPVVAAPRVEPVVETAEEQWMPEASVAASAACAVAYLVSLIPRKPPSVSASGVSVELNPGTFVNSGVSGQQPLRTTSMVMSEAAAPKKRTKPRLPALDSTRFFLIAYIALGHFMAAGGVRNAFALKFISQVNVVVGAFWVLSGYVAAYVSTELGKAEVIENRVSPLGPSFASRLMGYYPLYLLSQVLFLPVYLIADLKFGGPLTALKNAVMTTALAQSWFPLQAEAWNAPTWFLSAMTFATPPMLLALKPIAKMGQGALKKTFVALLLCSLLPKLWYSWTLDAWTIMEGMLNARTHPNIALFNVMRFNPVFALVELLLGIVGARMVMLKTEEETDASAKSGPPPVLLVAAMVGGLLARTLGYLQVNDMIFRSVFFVPCFTWFLQRVHAVTAQTGGAVGLIKQMAGKLPTYLGSLAFPIFVLHGPIGQIFYKKVVATKLFGVVLSKYPMLFGVWCAVVLGSAALVQKYFVESAKVKEFAKAAGKKLGDMLS